MSKDLLPGEYDSFLYGLKERIRNAQVRAALAVNRELVLLYWQLGRDILTRQQQQGWGAKVISQVAKDLQKAFPDMKGFSRTNLLYMRAFAEAYPDEPIVQQLAGQIPWFHNCILLDKVKNPEERLWYIQQTIQHGWSRSVLIQRVESGLYRRQGEAALTNFNQTLPQPQSELAQQILRDPYNFDFLSLGNEAQERELEIALIRHIREFLLEMGVGFAFVGSQYPIQVSGKEYRLDLLFYHFRLHCFVVVDLKTVEFEPEFSGKMNFYVSAVDDLLRSPIDHPTIGIILCKTQDQTIVEYALRDVSKPIGISTYQLKHALPEPLKGNLPTIEELEMQLNRLSVEPDS
ncbi:PDDEXK nuclease domain-containing protein (plasmid) [Kovacikia minuta CCNUW1]|uniref:PDDEXK nuclease domain-containing protein n=1 Tax=Kovacikia minuta TaxID=2931930 RepID=UPI001CCE44E4|nr:PDDEXK nuclease domain-containing protein [Kovacikia minuta]UBF30484.1 PDDEXK nuclease domain-containing protein [Kovacikia minuta CCNUW1]